MSAIAARLAREHSDPNSGLRVVPLKGSTTSDVGRNISQFALGLSGVVLLIACVNLANLQMASRATTCCGRTRLLPSCAESGAAGRVQVVTDRFREHKNVRRSAAPLRIGALNGVGCYWIEPLNAVDAEG